MCVPHSSPLIYSVLTSSQYFGGAVGILITISVVLPIFLPAVILLSLGFIVIGWFYSCSARILKRIGMLHLFWAGDWSLQLCQSLV